MLKYQRSNGHKKWNSDNDVYNDDDKVGESEYNDDGSSN